MGKIENVNEVEVSALIPYINNAKKHSDEQVDKAGCDDYGVDFDSLEFYAWVKAQPYPVFFSSYEISDKTFYSKKIKSVMSLIGANTNGQFRTEYLYSNQPFNEKETDTEVAS